MLYVRSSNGCVSATAARGNPFAKSLLARTDGRIVALDLRLPLFPAEKHLPLPPCLQIEPAQFLDHEIDEDVLGWAIGDQKHAMHRPGRVGHREVREDLHQATVLYIVGDGHAKLIGDNRPRLKGRHGGSKPLSSVSNWPSGTMLSTRWRTRRAKADPPVRYSARKKMRAQVFDGLRPVLASRDRGVTPTRNPMEIGQACD